MVTIKNDRIEVSIAECGAEIRRLTVDGIDRFWSGDPEFWSGIAPVLFPICGGLRDDKFTVCGKEYSLPKHGFAKSMDFTVERACSTSATMLLTDTPQTLSAFPWHFELRITYKLRGTSLETVYDVKNLSDSRMYFSIGSHEAYACPEGIEDYDVVFPQKETLETSELDGNLIAHSSRMILKDSDTLPLYNKFFAVDALVFKNLRSRSATLRNRKTGKSVTVDFPGCDYFLLWTKPGAGYICLEPWSGIPGTVDAGYAIEDKEGIIPLEPSKTFTRAHTIHF